MKLITKLQMDKLVANGAANAKAIATDGNTTDYPPLIKLFTPDANCTWLISEVDPERPNIAFGLCDLGFGCPELGNVDLEELREVTGPMGLHVERDKMFVADKTMREYANEARDAGGINC